MCKSGPQITGGGHGPPAPPVYGPAYQRHRREGSKLADENLNLKFEISKCYPQSRIAEGGSEKKWKGYLSREMM